MRQVLEEDLGSIILDVDTFHSRRWSLFTEDAMRVTDVRYEMCWKSCKLEKLKRMSQDEEETPLNDVGNRKLADAALK